MGVTHAHFGITQNLQRFPNQFLGWDFFCCYLQQDRSKDNGTTMYNVCNENKKKRKEKLMKAWMHKTQNASSEILIMSIIETLVQGCNAN